MAIVCSLLAQGLRSSLAVLAVLLKRFLGMKLLCLASAGSAAIGGYFFAR